MTKNAEQYVWTSGALFSSLTVFYKPKWTSSTLFDDKYKKIASILLNSGIDVREQLKITAFATIRGRNVHLKMIQRLFQQVISFSIEVATKL